MRSGICSDLCFKGNLRSGQGADRDSDGGDNDEELGESHFTVLESRVVFEGAICEENLLDGQKYSAIRTVYIPGDYSSPIMAQNPHRCVSVLHWPIQ